MESHQARETLLYQSRHYLLLLTEEVCLTSHKNLKEAVSKVRLKSTDILFQEAQKQLKKKLKTMALGSITLSRTCSSTNRFNNNLFNAKLLRVLAAKVHSHLEANRSQQG